MPDQENMEFYRGAAEAVFANNPARKAAYAKDPDFFARSVEQKLSELKQQYREFTLALGPIGAALPPEEIKEGTDLHDRVAQLSVDFPHWEKLHSMWRMLPDVNPYAPSVEPPTGTMESDKSDILAIITMELECKKLELRIAEWLTHCAKYESETAKLNADLKLGDLKYQEHFLLMQHQREREKEAHQLRMLELHLAWRRSGNIASGAGPSTMPPPAHT